MDEPFHPPPGLEELPRSPVIRRPSWRDRLRNVGRRLWAPIAALIGLLAKLKSLVFVIFKFKLFASAITMLVTIAIYTLFWGWEFAALFVALIFCHEMGHAFELKRQGQPAAAPMFIPFVGAIIAMRGLPRDAWREAQVGLAGPIAGTIASFGVLIWADQVNSPLLHAAAYSGFFLNLFNLMPVVPLDGGRAMAALHPLVWLAGLLGLAALLVVWFNPILVLLVIIGGLDAYSRLKAWRRGQAGDYYNVSWPHRAMVLATYVGLAAVLVWGMHIALVPRPS
jgi:Zn-dependent protease